ncbi:related to C6 transcription factor [Phialocephala subalpina]|uniref:Related to C6 transcription factor n=1 Tax=Phialocephala subalpina TaxID=576137 RepID=A0A1L7WZK8_9HELO|nr:related to C6 transcription factor [Phialocephala subalpina]
MSASPDAHSNPPPSGTKRKRRVYQACEPCRIRKAKCDRGSEDDPRPPPCARCMRESIQSQCILATKKNRRYLETIQQNERDSFSANPDHVAMQRESQAGTPSHHASQTPSSHANVSTPRSHHTGGQLHAQDKTDDNIRSPPRISRSQQNLTDSVIHTLISKPNDALALLFEAAGRQDTTAVNSRRQSPEDMQEDSADQGGSLDPMLRSRDRLPAQLPTPHSSTSPIASLSSPSVETVDLWKRHPFVRQGWLTAEEGISYVDLFFRNLSPLSPILLDYYADHSNHRELIFEEPMLCTTIICISSRYHILSTDGGMLRSNDIHSKAWRYWKDLFMRVSCGEEATSKAKTRAIGTIEGFLLMTEWHSRALHFAPDSDGWDCGTDSMDEGGNGLDSPIKANEKKTTEEVEGPSQRSDRMSWMLLGSALTLAHELGVSDQKLQNRDMTSTSYSNEKDRLRAEFWELRARRPRRLLYVYINQLASRLGWTSMIPRIISESADLTYQNEKEKHWHNIMSRWISLTRLMKTASDMLFSSVITKQLLDSGNYVTSLEHFGHLLEGWRMEYLDLNADKRLLDILFIEFQFARTYINSLAVQAVVERAFKAATPQSKPPNFFMTCVFEQHSVDYAFIQQVVDGSRNILKTVIALNEEGHLRYCPVRIFSRVISASILLLKATGLGTRIEEAQLSLELLDRLIRALRYDPVDELHLANRYASLLETYVKAFRRRFLRISRSRDSSSRDPTLNRNNMSLSQDQQRVINESFAPDCGSGMAGFNGMGMERGMDDAGERNWGVGGNGGILGDGVSFGDDWMCLPFDAFDPAITEFNIGLGARGLDFFSVGT